jgi:hypothetical protein
MTPVKPRSNDSMASPHVDSKWHDRKQANDQKQRDSFRKKQSDALSEGTKSVDKEK